MTTPFRIAPPHFYDTGRHLLKYSALEDRREDAEVSEDERLGKGYFQHCLYGFALDGCGHPFLKVLFLCPC